ncbi:lipopolysaccharide transport periplasmic protein LptA [Neptuniibacter sp. QD72_48]|uniref:lipopolysaccharide transport periplasmic protein LptA n=1 Tax=Neptuniibacter sp. QD72_48 TaxID=3398214 RepID=UPI0039F626CF
MLIRLLQTLVALGVLASNIVFALPDDQDKPIYITADSASINDTTGITTYKGNVIIKQGSLLIEAAHVDMHRANGDVDKLVAKGSPAHFRQQQEVNGNFTDAWGRHMVYMVNKKELTITQNAKVIQAKDTFTGTKIVYDLNKSIVNAFGSTSANSKDKGRVNMVIQPSKKK